MSRFQPGPFGFAQRPTQYASPAGTLSEGQFFNAVYAWMATGLALTGVVAYAVASGRLPIPLTGGTGLILLLVEFGLVIAISRAIQGMSAAVATALFLLFAALNGITLSTLFFAYTHATLSSAFLVTAGTFAAMSIYGYTTHRDLTRFGSLLFAALIGIILATIVNAFWQNPALYWAVSYLGVLLFLGLTAFDTQRLRGIAAQTGGDAALASRLAVVGSLMLYLDFLNLFIFLLQIMGNGGNGRRR